MPSALAFRARVAVAPKRATAAPSSSARRTVARPPRAGPLDAIGDAIAENKRAQAARAASARASPPGVPPPPIVPVAQPPLFGFVDNAERWNSRASMVGWWSLLLVEGVAGKGLLDLVGVKTGQGINFTF
jgi:hypothetical protein